MKVIHVNFSKSYRGGEHQTIELMKELKKYGIKQELICRNNLHLKEAAKLIGDVKLTEALGPFYGHFGRNNDKLENTVIHAHDGRAVYWAWIEGLIRNTPYLITRRVINVIGASWVTRQAYQGAKKLIAVSRYAANILEGTVGRKVEVIYDGCRELNSSGRNQFQASGSNVAEYPIIGHVGAFDDAVKGQSILIEAFLLLLADYPTARLYLIGDGKDLHFFREKYKLRKEIVFVGAVDDVSKWLATFNLFCFPSRIEALGSSVLEAMSQGVPVIVSNAGGLPELIGNDERGVVVRIPSAASWAEAVKVALKSPKETALRLENAQKFVNEISGKSMAQRYKICYDEIIAL